MGLEREEIIRLEDQRKQAERNAQQASASASSSSAASWLASGMPQSIPENEELVAEVEIPKPDMGSSLDSEESGFATAVEATAADTALLEDWIGFKPSTPIERGIEAFARWYCSYYKEQ